MNFMKILSYIWYLVGFFGIIYIYDRFGFGGGLLYVVGVLTLVIIIRIVTRWEQYMMLLKSVETQIWGRPLDKVYGKPPKVKFVWRKKNGNKEMEKGSNSDE